jgi:hypothetical protein
MTRTLFLTGCLALSVAPLAGAQSAPAPTQQQATPPKGSGSIPQVYVPEKLSPTKLQARNAVSILRDSVSVATGALSSLSADITTTSSAVLVSRAATVVDRCNAVERQRKHSIEQLSVLQFTDPDELKAQQDMLKSMAQLQKPTDQCLATYVPLAKPGKGQEIRDYGNARATPIMTGFREYAAGLKAFSKGMDIQYRPMLNAGASPLDQ